MNATPTVKIVLNKGKQIWKPKGKLSDNSLNKTKQIWQPKGKLSDNSLNKTKQVWRPKGNCPDNSIEQDKQVGSTASYDMYTMWYRSPLDIWTQRSKLELEGMNCSLRINSEPVPMATVVNAPIVSTNTSVSTMIAQDAPSTSHSLSSSQVYPLVFPQGVAARPTIEDTQLLKPNLQSLNHLRRWTKDHPIDNIIDNPSRPVSTRKQLTSDALWCCFHTELSKVEPKNFKMAMIEDCWFQAMQDEIHEFDRLEVWELVPRLSTRIDLQRISSEEGIVLKIVCLVCTDRGHQNIHCQCCNQEYDHLPDGCQNCFFEWRKGNLLLDLQKLQKNPIFRILVDIHQNTNFVRAFTTSANVPSIYIQLFWNTLNHDAKTGVYSFQVDEHWLTLSADLLRKALNVTPADSAHPFESPPAGKTDITFTRRRVPSNWLMKMKFNRLLNLIWMIMGTIYNKTTRKLPVVEVKGKGSATDVQAAKSLLELHKPKKQHAESGGNSEKVGSNSEQSHVALAGPNPEHMHDVFLATNYPKVHESLKHTTKEHIHLENPPSSFITLSSMKNLKDS
ncbi:hypothetical protein Tco_1069510 [Tanacetum coccineum]|uniref:Uncharacterized protein n=1 Tax=Tanacetum coccineum TaxID=301880 RepID=A0ABQ5HIS1_9ASTR